MKTTTGLVIATSALAALALSGCGTMAKVRADQADRMARFTASVPICSTDSECKIAWAAARNWIITSCGMKIQNIADGYIETYGSSTTALACRVMGEPRPDGSWALVMRTSCGNMFGCVPDAWDSAFEFNRVVAQAIAGVRANAEAAP